MAFADPEEMFPVKCPLGRIVLNEFEVYNCMTEKQKQLYSSFKEKQMYQRKGYEVFNCLHCNSYQFYEQEKIPKIFICENEECGVKTCTGGLKDIEMTESEQEKNHDICNELKKLKKEWGDAILHGSTRKCPECGLRVTKDEGCLHMTCPKCLSLWCYFCEKLINPTNHNEEESTSHCSGWQENKNKCPKYLYEASETDTRYFAANVPDSDLKNLEVLHGLLILKNIKNFVSKHRDKFEDFYNNFAEVRACEEEILKAKDFDGVLLRRNSEAIDLTKN